MNLDRVNDFFGEWWHVLVSFAAIIVIGVMGFVFVSVAEDRADKERTNEQLQQIIDTERRQQDSRDERLGDAVEQVRQVFAESLQHHDAQMNRLMARQLEDLARLLQRPQGTPPDPVTARPQPAPAPAPSPPATSSPSGPTSSSSPTTTAPAPTTPRQRSCDRHPSGPHC